MTHFAHRAALVVLAALIGYSQAPANAGSVADVFVRAQQAAFDQTSFRITTDTVNGSEHLKVIVEYQKPDRIHEIIGKEAEIVSIGKSAFIRSGKRPWQRNAAFSDLARQARNALTGPVVLEGATITPLGSENLNGAPTATYRVNFKSDGVNGEAKYWIGASDHLVRRAETTAKGTRISTITAEYNVPVTINAPL